MGTRSNEYSQSRFWISIPQQTPVFLYKSGGLHFMDIFSDGYTQNNLGNEQLFPNKMANQLPEVNKEQEGTHLSHKDKIWCVSLKRIENRQ